ncbi:TRAP transporter small permease [Chloroflexota bacterium]
MTASDVTGRYLLNRPITGSLELSELALAVIVFFALTQAEVSKQHIRVDVLTRFLSPKMLSLTEIITCLAGIVICSLIAVYSWEHFLKMYAIKQLTPGELRMPLYWPKMTVPVGYFLLVLYFSGVCVREIKNLFK